MKTSNLILKSAIVAALGLVSVGAQAGTTAFGAVATYAVEGIPSTGAVTIPSGITYTTTAGAAESGLLTITLPTGVTFVSEPQATGDGVVVTGTVTKAGGGVGSNFITYNYTRTAAAGGTITLNAFQITGANALSSVTNTGFQYTAQSSGFTTATNNDADPVSADLARSGRQLGVTPIANPLTINVLSPSNATRWVALGNSIATSGDVGTLQVVNNTFRNAVNTAAFTFNSNTATVTLTGNFGNVASAYLAPVANPLATCQATAPSGATVGAISGGNITFAGVTPNPAARRVCLVATGNSILQATANGISVRVQQDSATTSPNATLGPVTYNGGVYPINYIVGASGGFASYLRIVNRNASPAEVRVVVQNDNATPSSGLLGTVAANSGTLYTTADINAATGSTLNVNTDRASLVVLTPNANVSADSLMGNPNGTVLSLP